MDGGRSFRVFYRDYGSGATIPSSRPEPLAAERLPALADRLLDSADNFLGVVDEEESILQLSLDENGRDLVLELLFPEGPGRLRLVCPRAEALALLADLPERFDESLLPGASYMG